MFQEACETARGYTCPYVGLRRKHDGTIFSTLGVFIVVNEDGWAITAKHIFDEIARAQRSIAEYPKLDTQLEELRLQTGGNAKRRNREIRRLEKQKGGFLANHAEIWSAGAEWQANAPLVVDARMHPVADLALFRIQPFTPNVDQRYPEFRTAQISPGLSVCRMGFPWHSVEAEFTADGFAVKSGFPAPLFIQDGVVSRFVVMEHPDGSKATYVQTSTPGLRGQSGGPLFDERGRICGLQSSTTHLDLGFDAKYQRDGEEIVERQFLNVGQAVHVDDIVAFLKANDVSVAGAVRHAEVVGDV